MEKRHSVLFQQLEDYRQETLKAIDGLTNEDANIIPDGFSNNILWNLGHIYLDQYLCAHLTKETIPLPPGFKEWFNFGTKPADWKTPPPNLETLVSLLQEQPQKIQAAYKDRLDEEFPATESGMHTIAQVLVRTIFHEGMHLASLNTIRRFLGK
ncbi:DinB family protein [Brevibacillus brevis]|uniref:DinB family protein n=1 Tax=Brevibacillus brevis TaxID=1393 RepID=UPI001EDB1E2E|nr:DinB family protein [Brevibacillus brevis]UKK99399.1 DinB family protein [Brevibacillus brevis]